MLLRCKVWNASLPFIAWKIPNLKFIDANCFCCSILFYVLPFTYHLFPMFRSFPFYLIALSLFVNSRALLAPFTLSICSNDLHYSVCIFRIASISVFVCIALHANINLVRKTIVIGSIAREQKSFFYLFFAPWIPSQNCVQCNVIKNRRFPLMNIASYTYKNAVILIHFPVHMQNEE